MKNNTTPLTSLRLNPENIYIWVPSKMPKALNHLDKALLAEIHPEEETAKEFILYFLSFLSKTLFDDNRKDVSLHSGVLSSLLAPVPYTKIINACLVGTPEKGSFIIRNDLYLPCHQSKTFKFSPRYTNCRVTKYRLKTNLLEKVFLRNIGRSYDRLIHNIIVKNLLEIYPRLELPTRKFLIQDGKSKAADPEFKTKTGKKLIYRNRNPASRFVKKYSGIPKSFVEDNILKFQSLTDPCFLFPMPQGKKAGDRITDSFALMPSWIRAHIKIDGMTLAEVDFKALHPNIIMSLYGGRHKYLTHQRVAERLGIEKEDLPKFKKEHLAFFNKHPNDMRKSELLWEYYSNHESELLEKVISDKKRHRHTYTSKLMFTKEVDIMADCIRKLNTVGVYVLYVYDALLCEQKHRDTVEKIMNETVLEHGVFTATSALTETCHELHLRTPPMKADAVGFSPDHNEIRPIFGSSDQSWTKHAA